MIKSDQYINKVIFSEYLIQKKIGKGSFGVVYQGVVVSTNQKIAAKLEKRVKDDSGLLETEACRLYLMQGEGIPKIICYGNNQTHNILIQELLGKSLEELFNINGRKFSLKTVCSIGIEMIKRIKFVHSKFHIHRDIKPDNFMTGRDKNDNKISQKNNISNFILGKI
jgi:casein kinase 1